MTEFSGALNNPDFDGNTNLRECEVSKCLCISGLETFEFGTSDKIIVYLSLMGNIMTPYAFVVGEKYTNFTYNCYKFIKNEKIDERTLLNRSDDSLDPYDYHLEKCDKDVFKTIEADRIHSSWPVWNVVLLRNMMKMKRMLKRLLIYKN